MSAASPKVGVDIGGTTTRVVAFDDDLAVVGTRIAPTPRGADALVALVSSLVTELSGERRPHQVAVGVPGLVDPARGLVRGAVNLGITSPVEIGTLLADALGTPVHVENDVNAAALGVFHHLVLPATSSLAYVNVGTGLAAGFVLGGRLWRGAFGGAGEIGHLPIGHDRSCGCGQTGCAEIAGAGRAVADPDRRDEALDAIAWAVQLCIMTLDVDAVVLGGGVTGQGPPLLAEIGERLVATERRATHLRLRLADRLQLAPPDVPIGSLGALLAAAESS